MRRKKNRSQPQEAEPFETWPNPKYFTRSASQPTSTPEEGNHDSFPTLQGPRRRMVGIPGSPPDLRRPPPGCSFHPRCPMAFAPCRSDLPLLRPATAVAPGQRVACHLYDPRYSAAEPPTQAEFAARYETKYAEALRGRSAL